MDVNSVKFCQNRQVVSEIWNMSCPHFFFQTAVVFDWLMDRWTGRRHRFSPLSFIVWWTVRPKQKEFKARTQTHTLCTMQAWCKTGYIYILNFDKSLRKSALKKRSYEQVSGRSTLPTGRSGRSTKPTHAEEGSGKCQLCLDHPLWWP